VVELTEGLTEGLTEELAVAGMARTVTHVNGVLPAASRQWLVLHVGRHGRGYEASSALFNCFLRFFLPFTSDF
jgi:hypothetical protein